MEKLYLSDNLVFDKNKPYKLFCSVAKKEKLYWYSAQFRALNDYAYYITESINNRVKIFDENMKEILEHMQNEESNDIENQQCIIDEEFGDYDPVADYLGVEEEKILWLGITEPISKNTIIMNFLSFAEGVIKEMTFDFINNLKPDDKIDNKFNKNIIENCLRKISYYCEKDLSKELKKEINIIKQAKKVRNTFVHEQWISTENNVWDFKTREQLEKISIVDLINSITNILKTIERIGIELGVYSLY